MRLFNKRKIFGQDRSIQSKIIYNTKYNIVILVQYRDPNLYSAMQFLNNANKSGLVTLIAHYAESKEEPRETSNSTGKIKINTPIEYINQKYYMLVSGTPSQYADIYNHLELSNPILESITLEIYNNVSSTPFKDLITNGVLNEDNFKYTSRDAVYDRISIVQSNIKDSKIYYDDFSLIMGRTPSIFENINVINLIHVYQSEQDYINGTYVTPVEIVREMYKSMNHYDTSVGQESYFFNHDLIKTLEPLYNSIAPELIDISNMQSLYTLIAPIYMVEAFEDDVLLTGTIPMEKLDDIFQQEYDRFTSPLEDVVYVNVDEPVNQSPEEDE